MSCNHLPFSRIKSFPENMSFTLLDLKKRQETFDLYEWEDNSFYLYWKVVHFNIPDHSLIRSKYLFDRCQDFEEEQFLVNIYANWFEKTHREIPIFRKLAMIHDASIQNRIGQVLFSLFDENPLHSQKFKEWNLEHPHIFQSQL